MTTATASIGIVQRPAVPSVSVPSATPAADLIVASTTRVARRAWRESDAVRGAARRWWTEALTVAGVTLLALAAWLHPAAVPLAVAGGLAVLVPVVVRIRARPAADALIARDERVQGLHREIEGAVRTRLDRVVRDIALTAGLAESDIRVYRRDDDDFALMNGPIDAIAPVGDAMVLSSAWRNGVAKQPRPAAEAGASRSVVATRLNDRFTNEPLAVVVLAPGRVSSGDQSVRRARGSGAWDQLTHYLEVAALTDPNG